MSTLYAINEAGEDETTVQAIGPNVHESPVDINAVDFAAKRLSPYAANSVDNFLTDEDGTSLLDDLLDDATEDPSPSTSVLARTFSLASIASVDSVAPHFVTGRQGRTFPLAQFCNLIDQCASLERANILAVECHRERSRFGVLHRTLIFHLRRTGRSDVWLRIDRLRSDKVSIPALAFRGGKTEANDVAQIAASKADLLKRPSAKPENRIEFATPPSLGTFRFCLQVICEELLEYHVWPENCWFMCSLLQEHLFETGKGSFASGSHIRLGLAPQIRSRVWDRVFHLVPNLPSVSSLLTKLSTKYEPIHYPDLQLLAEIYDTYRLDGQGGTEAMVKLADNLRAVYEEVSRRPPTGALRTVTYHLAIRALLLERQLHQRHLPTEAARLLGAVLTYQLDAVHLGFDPQHLRDTKAQLELHRADPTENWHCAASQLIRLARVTSILDPPCATACSDEARAVLAKHSNGRRHWTDSQVLEGHTNWVSSVAFSPDGKQIASGSGDHTIRRWDALTGESVGEPMTGQEGDVNCVAFSPDGKQIILGSDDRTIRRWDANSGDPIGKPLRGHTELVWCVAFSPDGKQIASGSSDNAVRRWDAATGKSIGEPMGGQSGFVYSVAFSPDSAWIASGSGDSTIQLWDALTGKAIGEPLRGHANIVTSVVFSPNDKLLISGSGDGTIRRWDAITGESIGNPMEGHTNWVKSVAISPDGKQIASASDDYTIRLWDAATGDAIGEPLEGHISYVMSVAFSPDGKQIVSGSLDGTVRIWDSLDLDG